MKVRIIDENHESDLENSINELLSTCNGEIVDIKYQVSIGMFGEDQIYCFSAMIVYQD